ncbi:MAG: tyrosine recombinase, partial [Chitinophagaceae bacterium]|nr:tyrosine recombinase [Chitinophagaceae bacterium]
MLSGEQMVSKHTKEAYQSDLSQLFSYLKQHAIALADVSEYSLQQYTQTIAMKGLKSNSIARKISAIKTFFRFLVSEKELTVDPAVNLVMPKLQKSLPKALLQSDVFKLLEYQWPQSSPESIRTQAILEVLYASGMRITELLSLKMSALQFSPTGELLPFLIVKGKGRKERMVMMHGKAVAILTTYFALRSVFIPKGLKTDWVFPSLTKDGAVSHLSRQRVGQILKQIALEVGLDPSLVSPHKLRHSFASHLLQNGANLRVVQELLGHADISSTQIYTKVLNVDANNLLLSKHPLAE